MGSRFIEDINLTEYSNQFDSILSFRFSMDWFLMDNEELIVYINDNNISELNISEDNSYFNNAIVFQVVKNRTIIHKDIKDIEDLEEEINFNNYTLLDYKEFEVENRAQDVEVINILDNFEDAPDEIVVYIEYDSIGNQKESIYELSNQISKKNDKNDWDEFYIFDENIFSNLKVIEEKPPKNEVVKTKINPKIETISTETGIIFNDESSEEKPPKNEVVKTKINPKIETISTETGIIFNDESSEESLPENELEQVVNYSKIETISTETGIILNDEPSQDIISNKKNEKKVSLPQIKTISIGEIILNKKNIINNQNRKGNISKSWESFSLFQDKNRSQKIIMNHAKKQDDFNINESWEGFSLFQDKEKPEKIIEKKIGEILIENKLLPIVFPTIKPQQKIQKSSTVKSGEFGDISSIKIESKKTLEKISRNGVIPKNKDSKIPEPVKVETKVKVIPEPVKVETKPQPKVIPKPVKVETKPKPKPVKVETKPKLKVIPEPKRRDKFNTEIVPAKVVEMNNNISKEEKVQTVESKDENRYNTIFLKPILKY